LTVDACGVETLFEGGTGHYARKQRESGSVCFHPANWSFSTQTLRHPQSGQGCPSGACAAAIRSSVRQWSVCSGGVPSRSLRIAMARWRVISVVVIGLL
jgi:hypothetical protein